VAFHGFRDWNLLYFCHASLAGIFTDIPEIQAIAATGMPGDRLRLRIFLPLEWVLLLRHLNGQEDNQDAPVINNRLLLWFYGSSTA